MAEKKPLTERQQSLLDNLIGPCEGDIRAAMKASGYSDNTKIKDAIEPIKDHIIEAAQTQLAMNAPKAVAKLVGVLDNPTALGNSSVISAAERILDRTGLVKTERVQVEATQPGVFVLPAKDPK